MGMESSFNNPIPPQESMEEQAPAQPKTRVEKLMALKINEDPALQDKYERSRENLEISLSKIDLGELNKMKNEANERAQKNTGESADRYFDLEDTLGFLKTLKTIHNKDEFLEKFAKKKLFVLNNADTVASFLNQDIKDAIFQLSKTCESLAEWRFKEEYHGQIDRSLESKKGELQQKKDIYKNYNVTG